MIKKTCIQCGREFELSDDEIKFFQDKNLDIPKRCSDCRKENKKNKKNRYNNNHKKGSSGKKDNKDAFIKEEGPGEKNPDMSRDEDITVSSDNKTSGKKFSKVGAAGAIAACILAAVAGGKIANNNSQTLLEDPSGVVETVVDEKADAEAVVDDKADEIENVDLDIDIEGITFSFRNYARLNEHYEKHGEEMGFESAKEYEAAADKVIHDPKSLHKIEKEDGDYVFYLESTNEFVILSPDGYIRTYFNPNSGIDYYNRQ
ncbi:MAG: zinc-ribbon domain containing protein [Lachnospiraceae bacterium]|nr:zinc-ribbon domain containing protein [Lachnospiraceae bacterium]